MATKKQTSNLLAVIELSGKQYLVKEGDKIEAEKLDVKEGDNFTINEVLLVHDGAATKVGTPYVEAASVELKLEKEAKVIKIE